MKPRRALVTLALGDPYRNLWERSCRPNWAQYAARHGADVICFDTPLDASPRAMGRSPSWQKLLVLGQPQVQTYEQVVWLDADILLHPLAGWIGEGVPPERVGAADEYGYPNPELHRRGLSQLYRTWESQGISYEPNVTPQEFYRVAGFDREFDRAVQAGMMVVSPMHHREIFEYVYSNYTTSNLKGLTGEMRALSYELLCADLVHWLPPNWHAIWAIEKQLRYPFLLSEFNHPLLGECATRTLSQNYLLHFAGYGHELASVNLDAPALQAPPAPRVYAAPTLESTPRCEVPVALILFNRPETTARVMDAIRAARPRELYLLADGPRVDNARDAVRCAKARTVALNVDWECKVTTHFAETNLGLKRGIETGLDWLFIQVRSAIILEDDCLPQPSFFRFCQELLERYANDPRIMTISGSDFKFGLTDDPNSYSFSRYPLIWGWATWRRAWQLNDPAMRGLAEAIATQKFQQRFDDPRAVQYWEFYLKQEQELQTSWDSAWLWSQWEHEGLSAVANVNLVENIGFGADATHTHDASQPMAELLSEPMQFPLRHPTQVARDARGDVLIEETLFSGTVRRLWGRVRQDRIARKRQTRKAL